MVCCLMKYHSDTHRPTLLLRKLARIATNNNFALSAAFCDNNVDLAANALSHFQMEDFFHLFSTSSCGFQYTATRSDGLYERGTMLLRVLFDSVQNQTVHLQQVCDFTVLAVNLLYFRSN